MVEFLKTHGTAFHELRRVAVLHPPQGHDRGAGARGEKRVR